METIKIFVTHTPNRESARVELPIFEHVIAGAVYNKKESTLTKDNTGDNISEKNKSYCELTTQYWAWKNTDYDYYGFCHYRRYFSFNDQELKESDWGTIEYPYFTQNAIEELCLNEKAIREKVTHYDFLIARGIPIRTLRAKNIRDHYDKAPELYVEDFDIMMDVIREKYPDLYPCAQKYAAGKISYPCNMFIMQKKLFHEYSEMMFDVLGECEKRMDTSVYCTQSYRSIGHLSERLLGIYYLYLQEKGGYRLGELQIALFKNTERIDKIIPTSPDAIPVVLAANNYYSPMLCTCIQSMLDHISENKQYDIVIFHTNIALRNQSKIIDAAAGYENVMIKFLNISSIVEDYKLAARNHITTETFYRFLILDLMQEYEKVVYIDCDLIVCEDIAKLHQTEMGNNLIAAAIDPDFLGQLNRPDKKMMKYNQKILNLKDPYKYFQAGVLVMNIPEFRKKTTVKELLELADKDLYLFSDQDILNILCEDRVTYLDMRWNHIFDCNSERVMKVVSWAPVAVYDEYMEARKNPYIIHYAGFKKPWDDPEEEFADKFWYYARKTCYYEVLLARQSKHVTDDVMAWHLKNNMLRRMRSKILYFFLPAGSKRRDVARNMWYRVFGEP